MGTLHAAFCICGKGYSAFFSAGSSGFRDFAGCFGSGVTRTMRVRMRLSFTWPTVT